LSLEFLDFDKMKLKERVNGDEIDRRIEALLRSQEEFRKSQEKGYQEIRDAQKKTDEEINRLVEDQKKTDLQLKKTDEEQRKTDEQLKKLGKHIGDLTNGWGKFVLGLSEPSVIASLKDIGFELLATASPYRYRKNGNEYEIDIFCEGRDNGKPTVIAIEVKSSLNQQKLKEFIEKLKEFREFFPRYEKSKLIAGIAGIRFASGVKEKAEKEGLYLFSVKEDLMKNINSHGFKPKIW
jgi:hypothetical protein